MSQFIIQCDINTEVSHQIDALRPQHLNYIKGKSNILYGGVMLGESGNYIGICYVIKADAISDAEGFVKGDPYLPLYRKYAITKFVQKIPANA